MGNYYVQQIKPWDVYMPVNRKDEKPAQPDLDLRRIIGLYKPNISKK